MAARGWLELGNVREAREELKLISLPTRFHPSVLLVRWEIYARDGYWEFAHTIAHGLVAMAPEESKGWINRSIALHALKRTPEAWCSLLTASQKFPKNPVIAYNLACYASQLGHLEDANQWLLKAFKLEPASQLKAASLKDSDIKPLWLYLAENRQPQPPI